MLNKKLAIVSILCYNMVKSGGVSAFYAGGGECLSQRNRSLILGAEMLTGRSVKDKGSGGIW